MADPLRVGLLFGGPSVEHEISVQSARSVRAGLEEGPHVCVPVAVTEAGTWLTPERSASVLRGDASRAEGIASEDTPRVVVEPGAGDLVVVEPDGSSRRMGVDVVFPLIHGWGGEDGRVQGLLEWAGIPYVGAGVLGSAVGMDKAIAKELFSRAELPVGAWLAFHGDAYRERPEGWHERIRNEIGFPLFVKPSNGGSSVGITRVDEDDGLPTAIGAAVACDSKIVVEAGIDAREVECAVIGNEAPRASVVGEILPSREFYDYAAKYEDGTSELLIPAPLPDEVAERIRRLAVSAYRCLDLAGLARVDFFVERDTDRVLLNEVNTLPGFTSISMFPKLWEASGVPYPELLEQLVRLGLARWTAQHKRATRR